MALVFMKGLIGLSTHFLNLLEKKKKKKENNINPTCCKINM